MGATAGPEVTLVLGDSKSAAKIVGWLNSSVRTETSSIPASPILRSGPKASGLELFYFSSRATTQEVEGTITYLNIFLRIVADPRQQFIVHQPLTGGEKDIDPVVQGHRKSVPRQESDRAVPQRQAVEKQRVIETDVERENC